MNDKFHLVLSEIRIWFQLRPQLATSIHGGLTGHIRPEVPELLPDSARLTQTGEPGNLEKIKSFWFFWLYNEKAISSSLEFFFFFFPFFRTAHLCKKIINTQNKPEMTVKAWLVFLHQLCFVCQVFKTFKQVARQYFKHIVQ